ncbi:hypothetical protein SSOG_00471 [Streptomyces himastatinicus ATCC 53653]|uniref:Uncharacterized protein n=2 Tax=Streptomyces violaceusniger group TaxID=2839105 RepID=D9WAW5_9ACTN|nr:hypothetical protein SSOG_00471 [Streptomyces himastatinicus ATCC 53653]
MWLVSAYSIACVSFVKHSITKEGKVMDFTRVETAEISDADLDNVAGGIGASVNADVNADTPLITIEAPGVDPVTV